MKINVSNGKYTFVMDGNVVNILRYGELYRSQKIAGNAIHSLMCELDAARVVVAAARELCNKQNFGIGELEKAIKLHDSLVDDLEPPSEWTVK